MKITNDINGIIVLDKPKDHTSNDCLSIIKKYLHPKKLGHTGTLDTNATGVLVCLLGDATKCQEYLMKTGDKVYEAELIIGFSTDTEDILGAITNVYDGDLSKIAIDDIKECAKSFIGEYDQVPPMYSAKKVGGKKLLNLARKGEVIDRKPCKVKINNIDVIDISDCKEKDINVKKVKLIISCSKGTYIRTLCKDIGDKINVPSCMGELRRTKTSCFCIEESVKLDDIKQMANRNDYSFIKPCYYQEYDTALTFGKFETLHLGHQEIINKVVSLAKENSIKSTVLIVGNNADSKLLTNAQRISKLKYLGIDNIFNFKLDEYNKRMSPESFVDEILYKQLKSKFIVVGSDCRFGYMGKGDSDLLEKLCKERNIKVYVIDKLKVENLDIDISSTYLNSEYDKGNVNLVNKLLGKE